MHRSLLPPLLCLVALSGCGGREGGQAPTADTAALDQALVDDTADTAAASSQSSGLARSLFLALDSRIAGADPAIQLKGASDLVLAGYMPLGCATLSTEGPGHVRITFADCATPAGLAHVSGGLDVVLTGEPGRVHVALGAPGGLVANGASLAYSANADIVTSDGTQTIAWRTTTWRATTARGTIVSHTADYTITLDLATRCSVTAGSTTGQVEATDAAGHVESRGLDTVIDDLGVCPGKCPTSGTIRSTGEKTHHTVVLRFDGSAVAHVTGVHGAMFDIPLACGG